MSDAKKKRSSSKRSKKRAPIATPVAPMPACDSDETPTPVEGVRLTSEDLEIPTPAVEREREWVPPEVRPTKKPEFKSQPTAKQGLVYTPPNDVVMDREAICGAAYAELLAHGMSPRDAADAMESIADRLRLGGEESDSIPESGFYDLRDEQDYTYPRGANKTEMRGNAPLLRDPASITTIVVHQTACEYGVSKQSVREAGGNIELARARRALDAACHAMAMCSGYFVAAHPLRAYVNHGNRFNSYSLGLEIEGRYPGLEDDPSTMAREDLRTTWGGAPTLLTDETMRAACAALGWLVVEGRKEGMPLEYIVSHRQSSDDRRSDPGQEIWQRVVLEFAVPELSLTPMLESKWRAGRPVPTQWDPNGIGDY